MIGVVYDIKCLFLQRKKHWQKCQKHQKVDISIIRKCFATCPHVFIISKNNKQMAHMILRQHDVAKNKMETVSKQEPISVLTISYMKIGISR